MRICLSARSYSAWYPLIAFWRKRHPEPVQCSRNITQSSRRSEDHNTNVTLAVGRLVRTTWKNEKSPILMSCHETLSPRNVNDKNLNYMLTGLDRWTTNTTTYSFGQTRRLPKPSKFWRKSFSLVDINSRLYSKSLQWRPETTVRTLFASEND